MTAQLQNRDARSRRRPRKKPRRPYRARCATCGHSRLLSEMGWFRRGGWSFKLGFCRQCATYRWIVVEKVPAGETATVA